MPAQETEVQGEGLIGPQPHQLSVENKLECLLPADGSNRKQEPVKLPRDRSNPEERYCDHDHGRGLGPQGMEVGVVLI